MEISKTTLERFFEDFPQGGTLLILSHNHPDPDTLSSAAALKEIAHVLGKAHTTLAYGGIIGRVENANMVKLLGLNVKPIDEIDVKSFDRIAMVDTQPTTGNNALGKRMPHLVIDHHPQIPPTKKVPFVDIRTDYGATASILTEYLFRFGLEVDKQLATALLYGIKSETQDLGREAYPVDVESYLRLFPLADKKLLSKIVNSRVRKSYYTYLHQALETSQVYDNTLVSRLGEVDSPDIIPEIADLLLLMEGAAWSFCAGTYQGSIYLSIRTTNPKKNAGALMKHLVKGKGTGGGHMRIAGGKIDVKADASWQLQEEIEKTEKEFLKSIKKHDYHPSKLID